MRNFKLFLAISLVLFWLTLDYSYENSLVPNYGYNYSFRQAEYLVFLLLGALLLFSMRFIRSTLNYHVFVITTMLVYIPNGVMYYSHHGNNTILAGAFLFSILPLFFQSKKGSTFKLLRNISSDRLPLFMLITSIILLIPFVIIYGIPNSLDSLLLQDIYEVREESGGKANAYINYLNSPIGKVLLPTTIILSIIKRKWLILIVAIILQVYIFLIIPHKSVLAFLIIALFFSLFNSPRPQLLYFIGGLGFIVILGTYLMYEFGSPYLESYLSRRSFFVPASLNNSYFEVFKDDKLYLSYSKINPFVAYNHDTGPARYVGSVYLGKDIVANTGILGSGYMNFGFLGIVGNILVFSLITQYLNRLNYNHKYFGLILIMIITFNSSYLFTSIFTHGMLMMFLVLNELGQEKK